MKRLLFWTVTTALGVILGAMWRQLLAPMLGINTRHIKRPV